MTVYKLVSKHYNDMKPNLVDQTCELLKW